MKVTRVLFGIGVGVAAGFAVSLRNRDDQSVKNNTIDGGQPTGAQSELQRELETMKQSFNDILNYSSQIKNEGTEFGSLIGDEIKTLIGNFKSDINPNIEKLQSHIENLQNRGEEISNTFSKEK
ncbi:YtxH domain-containing protein [Staphylococcus warneri]|uniref:YtxH domain-containing protein n=1 Tax=Staphylococcus warneri TaxID=1292 RepID=UPI000E68CA5E|nr:YtxH domain-containing protein [Staphylococcus warneri]QNQ44884.1 YtxH domain-containing protein [Staphylococcus warneri]RIN14220.1 YtxH domain-containing protein [Staphylococcus warneri]WNF17242.1 YtxH domain-containing protein [Staphylococcus warneri]